MKDLPREKEQVQEVKGPLVKLYRWWNDLSTTKAEDRVWLNLLRILVRVVGIVILMILSPFLVLMLLIAFFAAL